MRKTMNDKIEMLKELYESKSKHSQYHPLPPLLKKMMKTDTPNERFHYEKERMDYITEKIKLGKRVLDIGGNSGFFTFDALRLGCEHVDYFEGDTDLAKFVSIASEVLEESEKITVHAEYYDFDHPSGQYDTIFVLNVLHHMGADFTQGIGMETAKKEILEALNRLAMHTKFMIFQMGFNWGGNAEKCLFPHGTKQEMIDYIKGGTSTCWEICNIGIPVKIVENYRYCDAEAINLIRRDEYGEFMNRPLFIMKSRLYYEA